ncbi:energy-coupling factor transport system ATP-binding protein [Methanococcoides vulcani]|uniref:Energy-coupling factor transport system ATP-binding protein n=1 Tax=Methanococcoides vulcani TaxID=1353158 RepID=A0A1H9YIN9_9EURY|nr:energy-coupling factor transporter ATPase [Methanococcoides vulcani]SES68928.1 energy-coupling factor transport system ATP-binding protein [Methanococcoides vulcani]
MIVIEDLWYTYPGRNEPTLRGIDLTIEEGEFVLITGPTGCGKSTLLKMLNGIIPHESGGEMTGKVNINDVNTADSCMMDLAQLTGLVFQNPDDQIFSTVVEDEIAFGPENLCFSKSEIDRRVLDSLEMVGMSDHRYAQTSKLSGGQKQRICIASMLAMMPGILVLDEPISQLDPKGAADVMHTIRELNRKLDLTIVLVEHRLHEIAHLVDRIVVMDEGKIVLDAPISKAFEHIGLFHSLGLRIPETVELFHRLGYDRLPLLVDDALDMLGKQSGCNTVPLYESSDYPNEQCNRGDPVISITDVWFGYEKDTMVLKGIDLDIHEGERVALMGTNGSGKSTLLLHLSAMLKPDKGSVEIMGIDTGSKGPYSFASKVGLVFQNPDLMLFCDSVEEEVRFAPSNLGLEDPVQMAGNALESMSILDLRLDPPQALSRGQRLRTAVASVLSVQPKLMLLDEPTTGQDKLHIEQMMEHFVKNDNTLVFCTHDVETAIRYATRIVVMNEGTVLADGDSRGVFKDVEVLERASLKQPCAMQIARSLGLDAFCVDELVEIL